MKVVKIKPKNKEGGVIERVKSALSNTSDKLRRSLSRVSNDKK
jgi:hypothetical protein